MRDYAKICADAEKMQLLEETRFPWLIERKKFYSPSEEAQVIWIAYYKKLVRFINEYKRLTETIRECEIVYVVLENLRMLDNGALDETRIELMTRIKDRLSQLFKNI